MIFGANPARMPWAETVLAVALAVLLSGCVTNARTVYDQPTLHPGETVSCVSDPCSVYFETPAGSGTHIVKESGVKAGEVTGGQRAYIGSYWSGQKVFTVEGTDLPEAYLDVMGVD